MCTLRLYPLLYTAICFLFAFNVACDEGGQAFAEQIRREVSHQPRHDTLPLGLHFGMTSVQFFAHCREANQAGHMRNGNGQLVSYRVPVNQLGAGLDIEFYPSVRRGQLISLPGQVSHTAYSVFGTAYNAAAILPLVRSYFETALDGDGNFERVAADDEEIYVRRDGNRRLYLRVAPPQYVEFQFDDLSMASDSVLLNLDLVHYVERDRYVLN